MILGRFTLAMLLFAAPAMWAQYSRTDMTKLAADRFSTASKTLNLSPAQAAQIQPLLETKYVYLGQIKDVYRASDKSSAPKKTAKDSIKSVNDKYHAKIVAVLNPEQAKDWKRLQHDWRADVSIPKS